VECVAKSIGSQITLINLTKMAEIYKVLTLNINGISAGGRMGMHNDFIHNRKSTLSYCKR